MICKYCGVAVDQNKAGRYIHLDGLPETVDDHDAAPTSQTDYMAEQDAAMQLRVTVEELVRHHMSFHPASACQFTDRVLAALRVQ